MNLNPQGWAANRDDDLNAGVDVCKAHLDACWGVEQLQVTNDAVGWDALVAKFSAARVNLVALEATGGYERGFVAVMQGAGFDVARLNARQARDFAKSLGMLAKTDRVDARALRDFADVLARHVDRAKFITPVPDPRREQLNALMTRRRQLVDMRVEEGNRLDTAHSIARRSILASLKALDKQIEVIDKDIAGRLDKHFKDQCKLLETVKGVGPVTILTMTAALPELGRLDRRAISKLVGVAPLCDDSGPRKGRRHTWGGRSQVRSVLYMATLTAIKHNPAIRVFHGRLIAVGKPKKVAIVACMRKLLTILNAMLRDHTVWDPTKNVKEAKTA
jgi:transposase